MRMVIPRSDAKIAFADHIAVGAFLRATNLDWTLVRAAVPPKKLAMSISRSNLARIMLDAN
jgi:hypothetical protein